VIKAMKLSNAIKDLIAGSKIGSFAVFLFVATILHSGIWFMPNMSDSLAIAQNPFISPPLPASSQYIFSSYLYHLIAYAVGATSPLGLFLLGLLFSCTFFWLSILLLRDEDGKTWKWLSLVFCMLPASYLVFSWVGMDGLTLTLFALILLSKRRLWLVGVLSTLLAWQHFEQGLIAFSLLLFAGLLLRDWRNVRFSTLVVAGLIFGRTLLAIWFQTLEISFVNRGDWLVQHFGLVLPMGLFSLGAVLWSLFGISWIVFLRAKLDQKALAALVICTFMLLALSLVSADQTRTIGIVSFPFVMQYLLLSPRLAENAKEFGSTWVALWLLVPTFWVWGGNIYSSLLFRDMALLFDYLFGLSVVPSNPAMWPFRSAF
jgi:hypothetical protein